MPTRKEIEDEMKRADERAKLPSKHEIEASTIIERLHNGLVTELADPSIKRMSVPRHLERGQKAINDYVLCIGQNYEFGITAEFNGKKVDANMRVVPDTVEVNHRGVQGYFFYCINMQDVIAAFTAAPSDEEIRAACVKASAAIGAKAIGRRL